jgi:hypothetical protein
MHTMTPGDARIPVPPFLFVNGVGIMNRVMSGLLVPFVLLVASPAICGDKPKDRVADKDQPATVAEQVKALDKDFSDASQAFQKAYAEAKTNEERQKIFQEKYPQPEKYAPKFLALAENNPKDPAAVDALLWVVTHSLNIQIGDGAKESPRSKAIAVLTRDHIQSEKLGQVCQGLTYNTDKASENLLRAILEKNPHRTVQGQACLALAQYLNLSQRVQKREAAKEIEELFERAAEKYGDVKTSYFGTVGAKAKAELFELRFLVVGKTAPDIEGEDQDGKKFKLSDYKGKVVLLDFWSEF